MVSASEHGERTLHAIEPVRNVFAALFIASIGLLLNPRFLWSHRAALLTCLALVVAAKTALTTLVVRAFGYSARTALIVGLSMAQVGEFSFVLLSRASSLRLVQRPAYLLLLGTTALSLLATPLIFRAQPALLRLGVAAGWLRASDLREDEDKAAAAAAGMGMGGSDSDAELGGGGGGGGGGGMGGGGGGEEGGGGGSSLADDGLLDGGEGVIAGAAGAALTSATSRVRSTAAMSLAAAAAANSSGGSGGGGGGGSGHNSYLRSGISSPKGL
jgi:uncharacterized membrane protein YgcG